MAVSEDVFAVVELVSEVGDEEVALTAVSSALRMGMAGAGLCSGTEPVLRSRYHRRTLFKNCTHFWDMTRPSMGSLEDES